MTQVVHEAVFYGKINMIPTLQNHLSGCRTWPSLNSYCQMCLPNVIVTSKSNNTALNYDNGSISHVMESNDVSSGGDRLWENLNDLPCTHLHMCHFPPSGWAQSHAGGSSSGFRGWAGERYPWWLEPNGPLHLVGFNQIWRRCGLMKRRSWIWINHWYSDGPSPCSMS